jgi:hypothetical protein
LAGSRRPGAECAQPHRSRTTAALGRGNPDTQGRRYPSRAFDRSTGECGAQTRRPHRPADTCRQWAACRLPGWGPGAGPPLHRTGLSDPIRVSKTMKAPARILRGPRCESTAPALGMRRCRSAARRNESRSVRRRRRLPVARRPMSAPGRQVSDSGCCLAGMIQRHDQAAHRRAAKRRIAESDEKK